MVKVISCPGADELHHFLSGEMTPAMLDSFAEHMESCPECQAKARTFATTDTFVQAMTTARELPEGPESQIVSQLISKLKSLSGAGPDAPVVPSASPPSTEAAAVSSAKITFPCGECRKLLRVNADLAGRKVKCPGCGTIATVNSATECKSASDQTQDLSGGDSVRIVDDRTHAHPDEEAVDFLRPAESAGEIGRLGSYRVMEVLGRGGMGVVFRAEDPGLKRVVALKAMLPALSASTTAKKRFLREAQTAANLKHDHIVTIFQVGEERGVPFMAMEYLHGETLDARLKREHKLPVSEVIRIGREIAEGLAAAHERGLIHRDIKPANIWLETPSRGATFSRVKILDFGLARSSSDEVGLTQYGAIVGTPAFMAPEQTTGQVVDARADLFSLGCAMYAMATGDAPFRGKDAFSTIMAVKSDAAVAPRTLNREVPTELSQFILRLLEKNPDDRPANADEVVATLNALRAGRTEAIHPARPADDHAPSGPVRSSRRWPLVAAGFAAFAALIALGLVFFLPTPNGTIRVEVNDDTIEVALTKSGVKVVTDDKQGVIVVAPGEHALKIKRGDLEFETDKFVLTRGDEVKVKIEYLNHKLVAVGNGKSLGTKESNAPQEGPKLAADKWTPTPEQEAFLENAAKLPLPARMQSVIRKLQELNDLPHGRLPWTPMIEAPDGEPTRCVIDEPFAAYLWPLAALPTIATLDISASSVTDYRPLTRLPLVDLKAPLVIDNVAGEKAIQSIRTLKTINDQPAAKYFAQRAEIRKEIDAMEAKSKFLSQEDQIAWLEAVMKKIHPTLAARYSAGAADITEVSLFRHYDWRILKFNLEGEKGLYDLSPVRALDIDTLSSNLPRFFDLSPLTRTKISHLTLNQGTARDISPLAQSSLKSLELGGTPVRNLLPLSDTKLESLTIKFGMPVVAAQLRDVPLKSLILHSTLIDDLAPLQQLPLTKLGLRGLRFENLSPLAGMKLEWLGLLDTAVTDVTPILKMRLKTLQLPPSVSDLSPFKAMPLEELWFNGEIVKDLSPLKGMRLKSLMGKGGAATDLTPLKGMPLTKLWITYVPERDAAVLRSLKSLQDLNGMPARELIDKLP